jgi:hypothetical protein
VNRQQRYGNARVPRLCCAAREVAPDASLEGIDAGGAVVGSQDAAVALIRANT